MLHPLRYLLAAFSIIVMLTACSTHITDRGLGTLEGTLKIGPNCPVERVGQPCLPPQAAFDARPVVVKDDNGNIIARAIAKVPDGEYSLPLLAGRYIVTVESASSIERIQLQRIEIKANETTEVNFTIDTGIR